jgi:hypothetical protein
MPRTKPRSDPIPTPEPFPFTNQQRRSLLSLLGFRLPKTFDDKSEENIALQDVEILVGWHLFNVAVVDRFPTNANLRDRLKSILVGRDLLARIGKLDEFSRGWLDFWLQPYGLHVNDESRLGDVRVAVQEAIASLGEMGRGRGRPALTSLRSLISGLGTVFDRVYRGKASRVRGERGFVRRLSPYEKAKRRFVRSALRWGNIRIPPDISRYFSAYDAPAVVKQARRSRR